MVQVLIPNPYIELTLCMLQVLSDMSVCSDRIPACEATMKILNEHNEENLDKYRYVAGKDSEKLGKEKTHIKQEQREWERLFHKYSHPNSWVYGHNPYLYLWKSFCRCSSSLVRAIWTF